MAILDVIRISCQKLIGILVNHLGNSNNQRTWLTELMHESLSQIGEAKLYAKRYKHSSIHQITG